MEAEAVAVHRQLERIVFLLPELVELGAEYLRLFIQVCVALWRPGIPYLGKARGGQAAYLGRVQERLRAGRVFYELVQVYLVL